MNLIEFNKYNNSVNQKIFKKGQKIALIILMVLMILIIILGVAYKANKSVQKTIDEYIFQKYIDENNTSYVEIPEMTSTISGLNDSSNNIEAFDKYIGILNKSIFSIYNSKGKKVKDLEVKIGDALFDSNGKFLAIAEKDGKKIELITDNEIKWEKSIDSNINRIFVNGNGYVSVISTGTNYKAIISVYNADGKELFKTYLAKTTAISAKVSEDNQFLAIAEVDTSGSLIQSNIKILSIEKAQTNPNESTIYTYNADIGNLILNIKYMKNNKLVCKYNNSIHIISNNEDSKIKDLEGKDIQFNDINLDNYIINIKSQNNENKNSSNIDISYIFDSTKYTYTIDGVVNMVETYKDVIAVNNGVDTYFIDTHGRLIKKYSSAKEVKRIILGNNIAGIIYSDKVEIIKI